VTTAEGDISALKSRTDQHATAIGNVERQTNTNTTDIRTLQGQTAAHATAIAGHGQRIGSLEQGLSSTDRRLGTVEASLSDYRAEVATYSGRIDRAERMSSVAMEGVAVALSIADPVLLSGDTFGLRVNWGNFEGRNAIGISTMGLLSVNAFGGGEKLSVGAGIGVGLGDASVGGRAGLQLSW
jgi:hypothetical protein